MTSREDFPPGIESRMAEFTELAALAIAKAQTEQELRELANIQAALRRLATLVARGEPQEVVFAAATREARRHFGGGTARMVRYEPDGTATLLANEGTTGPHVRVGDRWEGDPPTGLTVTVRRTGQAARVDDYRDVPGAAASGGTLRVRVRDSAGGADPVRGSGLAGLQDRIETLGGTFSVHSLPGRGTTVSCELPVLAGFAQPGADSGE